MTITPSCLAYNLCLFLPLDTYHFLPGVLRFFVYLLWLPGVDAELEDRGYVCFVSPGPGNEGTQRSSGSVAEVNYCFTSASPGIKAVHCLLVSEHVNVFFA